MCVFGYGNPDIRHVGVAEDDGFRAFRMFIAHPLDGVLRSPFQGTRWPHGGLWLSTLPMYKGIYTHKTMRGAVYSMDFEGSLCPVLAEVLVYGSVDEYRRVRSYGYYYNSYAGYRSSKCRIKGLWVIGKERVDAVRERYPDLRIEDITKDAMPNNKIWAGLVGAPRKRYY